MAKKVEEATAPHVSKYAAKKAARIASNAEVQPENDNEDAGVNDAEVEETTNKPSKTNKKSKGGTIVGKEKREIGIEVPAHVVEIAYIVKDNAAIRRHCSLNILNYLTQKGRIPANTKSKYVKFLWNKFRVTVNGLTSEFAYSEQFFLDALVASFGQFAKDAENTISIFVDKEQINNASEESNQ